MTLGYRWLLLIAALAAIPAWAQQNAAYVVRETDLKAKPFLDAEALGKLPEKATVTVLKRQGGWNQVKSGALEGWVPMLRLRLGNPDPKKNTTSIAAITGSFNQRPGAGPTATTGVRGFSEEDLKAAKPAPEEVKKLDDFAVSAGDAAAFAAAGKLTARTVAYVDADGKPVPVKK
ncbi:MAG: SH3 domain-containing protein [Burkholderiales bacterium]|nr:SH3 domain-containing protein [Burkholderiales bacterium]